MHEAKHHTFLPHEPTKETRTLVIKCPNFSTNLFLTYKHIPVLYYVTNFFCHLNLLEKTTYLNTPGLIHEVSL